MNIPPPHNFFDVLQGANLDMTAQEIAEALWLAYYMSPMRDAPETVSVQGSSALPSLLPENVLPPDEKQMQSTQKPPEATAEHNLYLRSSVTNNESSPSLNGQLVRMPAAPALAKPLTFEYALRPLRRKSRARKMLILNEKATVQQIAEMEKKVWLPVQEPAQIHQFDLALVIDEGESMVLWRQTIIELQALLERLGAFRDVRLWRLATDDSSQVHLFAGIDTAMGKQTLHSPQELIDPTRRRLVLFVTDCISPAWYSGKVQNVLELWGKENMVTLLQMLPQRLWTRTALSATKQICVAASVPGMANTRLQTLELAPWLKNELSMPLPIITLDQASVASWVQVVLGTENKTVTAVMFGKNLPHIFADALAEENKKRSLPAKERVHTFLAAVSQTTRKLARLLSAAIPISLPVVRLVQQIMVPEATQEHIAEVFLSGLLKVKENSVVFIKTNPDYVEYEFLPGVSDELKKTLPMTDEYQVIKEVSLFIAERLGFSRDFFAYINTPFSIASATITPNSLPFAALAAPLWRKLGGNYAERAKQFEQQLANVDDKREPTLALVVAEQHIKDVQQQEIQHQLEEARAIQDRETRAVALLNSILRRQELQASILPEVLATMRGTPSDGRYTRTFLKLLPNVQPEFQLVVVQEIVESARLITYMETRLEVLDEMVVSLPDAWKAEAVQQILVATRSMTDKELRRQTLNTLLKIVPKAVNHVVMRELQPPQKVSAPGMPRLDLTFKSFREGGLSPYVKCICPSCFNEIYPGECAIISGKTSGKELKRASKGRLARLNVEPLDGPKYTLELAHRQCYECDYLLPSNIENVASITFAVVGDTFSGKSHYIAALIYQLQTEWLSTTIAPSDGSYAQMTCLTPEIEKKYKLEAFDPIFIQKQTLPPTKRSKTPTMEPLIYNLAIVQSPSRKATTVNLMFYDTSGEDFESYESLVSSAKFVLNANAFIFVVDPFLIKPVFNQLPQSLQGRLQQQFKYAQGRRASERLSHIMDIVGRYRKLSSGSAFDDTPIAIMLSKVDLLKYLNLSQIYSCILNPRYRSHIDMNDLAIVDQEAKKFLAESMQADLVAATRRFKRVKFFATSATGGPSSEKGYFTHVEPRRCLDPMLWILNQFGVVQADE